MQNVWIILNLRHDQIASDANKHLRGLRTFLFSQHEVMQLWPNTHYAHHNSEPSKGIYSDICQLILVRATCLVWLYHLHACYTNNALKIITEQLWNYFIPANNAWLCVNLSFFWQTWRKQEQETQWDTCHIHFLSDLLSGSLTHFFFVTSKLKLHTFYHWSKPPAPHYILA